MDQDKLYFIFTKFDDVIQSSCDYLLETSYTYFSDFLYFWFLINELTINICDDLGYIVGTCQ
jgi:hypothetical protein